MPYLELNKVIYLKWNKTRYSYGAELFSADEREV